MMKAELKEKWGHYCDTDKLVDDMRTLLSKYDHRNSEFGVCSVLDAYFTNKRELIDMFATSDRYVGDMRIILDVELERTSNSRDVKCFCDNFYKDVDAGKAILEYVDEHGKCRDDYVRTGLTRLHVRKLFDKDVLSQLKSNCDAKANFCDNGSTVASNENAAKFHDIVVNGFGYNHQSTLQLSVANYIAEHKINATFATDMKTSRAFNRLCATYGVDKLPAYNKLFAKYADLVSGLKRKLKFFISLNPLDYLTMSFGVNWASCHTIDKRNIRRMPNDYSGAYCGGTMSYMLDQTSFITYVHDKIPTDVEEGKIYRNMFHYGRDILVQGRIYPQGNDGATDLYTEFRKIVQSEFTKLLGLESDVWVKRNRSCDSNTRTYGVHYADYLHFNQCNTTYPKERSESYENVINIGHERICPYCGDEISNDDLDSGRLTHYDCMPINNDGEVMLDDDWLNSL